ncbi:MAG: quinone-dependent dihydroorotate dehydrogenase [Rhodospirillales bacterium]|nr:quinone-dependent dihydroorotate dehydrogenase [Rhodospirillales bacterium]
MSFYSAAVRPLLFRFDAERMHHASIETAARMGWAQGFLSALYGFADPSLETEVCGLTFANPLGLAAGYDKSGEAVRALAGLGFGHVEIGSVSADPSAGNPKPRLFRLPADRALVVHYGLQNDGADVIARRVAAARLAVPLGVNIVKTNRGAGACPDGEDGIIGDYLRSVRLFKDGADYLTLNLSCPNTEMGRDFFADKPHVERFLAALGEVDIPCPVFLKVSPKSGIPGIEMLLEAAEAHDFVSGFVFNLPAGKPDNLVTPREVWESWPGAVSGHPVESLINFSIREMYRRMDTRRYRIVGVGGVFTAEQAYEKIRLGASLVQLLTALVYEGPGVVGRINRGLCGLLARDGFKTIAEAVGTAHT